MAIRKIVEIGDEKLRKCAKPVEKFDRRLKTLLEDMADTMYKAEGVGLAAPQVGILRRAVVVDVGEGLTALVNPEVVSREGEESSPEACLSIPGRSGLVSRPQKVTLRARDVQGNRVELTAEGFLARALSHELDHLDGVLYVDIMEKEIFPEEEMEPSEKESRGREVPGAEYPEETAPKEERA